MYSLWKIYVHTKYLSYLWLLEKPLHNDRVLCYVLCVCWCVCVCVYVYMCLYVGMCVCMSEV
jgi:hypothetical protein